MEEAPAGVNAKTRVDFRRRAFLDLFPSEFRPIAVAETLLLSRLRFRDLGFSAGPTYNSVVVASEVFLLRFHAWIISERRGGSGKDKGSEGE